MFKNNRLGLDFYSDPYRIQSAILSDHSKRLDNRYVIADPNNSFNYLLEAFSNISADLVTNLEHTLNGGVYTKRASRSEELYAHISDYDYLGLEATPASMNVTLSLDKDYLMERAEDMNASYKKVTIPKHTRISIGELNFGIYYPIDIIINKTTKFVTVTWDTSVHNPLCTLDSNTLPHVEFEYKKLRLLSIQIPVYNFTNTINSDTISTSLGYHTVLPYTDKFYAIRAFNSRDNRTWNEFEYALGRTYYNPNTPTLIMEVIKEKNQVKITIPQIYFTNRQIGEFLEIHLLSTKGKINVNLKDVTEREMVANFAFDNRETGVFSKVLANIPTIMLNPENSELVGGTDGYTFEEFKRFVTSGAIHARTAVTPRELEGTYAMLGYDLVKILDNLTERIYLAYTTLKDTKDVVIPLVNTQLKITEDIVKEVDTINSNIDGSVTIKPNTIYKYDETFNTITPLTTLERKEFLTCSKEKQVELLNEYRYTQGCYYIRLDRSARYPKALAYDLTSAHTERLYYSGDNTTLVEQQTVMSHTLICKDDDGYLFRVGMKRSDGLSSLDAPNLRVILLLTTSAGAQVHTYLEHIGEYKGLSIYEVTLKTDYDLGDNSTIGLTSLMDDNRNILEYQVPMVSEATIMTLVHESVPLANLEHAPHLESTLPKYLSEYVAVTSQTLQMVFGTQIPTLYHNTEVLYTLRQYKLYESDIPYTYVEDVYKRKADNTLEYTVENGKVVPVILHKRGERMYTPNGTLRIKHHKGDRVLDQYGKPTITQERSAQYYVDITTVDMRYLYGTLDSNTALKELASMIIANAENIRRTHAHLMGRTTVYYRPYSTIGAAHYALPSKATYPSNLELSLIVKLGIEKYVQEDTDALENIEKTIATYVSNYIANHKTLSTIELAASIKQALGTTITHIEIPGWDNTYHQTLMHLDEHTSPKLRHILKQKNNTYNYVPDIEIEYQVVD